MEKRIDHKTLFTHRLTSDVWRHIKQVFSFKCLDFLLYTFSFYYMHPEKMNKKRIGDYNRMLATKMCKFVSSGSQNKCLQFLSDTPVFTFWQCRSSAGTNRKFLWLLETQRNRGIGQWSKTDKVKDQNLFKNGKKIVH